MVTIHETNTNKLIEKSAEEFKKNNIVKAPDWSIFVKTGAHKERPPTDKGWWYKRAAAVLRKIYIKGPIGVSKLRSTYGGKKNRGHKPGKFYKGSGKIIRVILQQLEQAEFVKKEAKGVHKGRIITNKGKAFLDKLAK